VRGIPMCGQRRHTQSQREYNEVCQKLILLLHWAWVLGCCMGGRWPTLGEGATRRRPRHTNQRRFRGKSYFSTQTPRHELQILSATF